MTTELLPENGIAAPVAEVVIPVAPEAVIPTPPTEPPATEPEIVAPPADLEAVTAKFFKDRELPLPTEGVVGQNGNQPVVPPEEKLLTRAEAEALADERAAAKIAEQNSQQRSQSTTVAFRNRATNIAQVHQAVIDGRIALSDVVPNSATAEQPGGYTYAQYISNEFNQHHAQSGNVAVSAAFSNFIAGAVQDLPEAERKGFLERRVNDKSPADLHKDLIATATKGMVTAADAKKMAEAEFTKGALEFKKSIEHLLPGYVPPTQVASNTPAGTGSADLTEEEALSMPIDKLIAWKARRAASS